MSKEFAAADITLGQMNAIIKKLGGKDGALKLLRGELLVSGPFCSWREEDGVVYFSVTSDGTTGPQWVTRLRKKGWVNENARSVLCSKDFKPTCGVTTEVAVLKGKLFKDRQRITKNIRKVAEERKLVIPNAEIACLIREKFTDEEIKAMGLTWIVAMHDPIKDSNDDPLLLEVSRVGVGSSLDASCEKFLVHCETGYAFAVSQISRIQQ